MKTLFYILAFYVSFVSTVDANEVVVTEVAKPYDVVQMTSNPLYKTEYLGALEGYPVMYELTVTSSTTLALQLTQLASGDTPVPFALMVVRQNDRDGGVSEVKRFAPKEGDWAFRKDPVLGLSLLEGSVVEKRVGPGTYRIEVSTPDNVGRYRLTFGEEDVEVEGYFTMLGMIRTTQKSFGYSPLRMLMSSYLYYPLGIFVLLYLFYKANQWRKRVMYVG